jgi:hypothetical protein
MFNTNRICHCRTGKYRDLQRLNVKRAIRMMIDNSDLATRFALATAFAPLDQVTAATDYGNTAVEALTQIIEYFPQDLQANDLGPEQKKFVTNALATASKSIDSFLMLMPKDTVDAARAQLEEASAATCQVQPLLPLWLHYSHAPLRAVHDAGECAQLEGVPQG